MGCGPKKFKGECGNCGHSIIFFLNGKCYHLGYFGYLNRKCKSCDCKNPQTKRMKRIKKSLNQFI